MAQLSTKINRFISAHNLTSGIVKHLQSQSLHLIKCLPNPEFHVIYQMATEAINTGKPVCTIYQKQDYFHKVEQLLAINGVTSKFVNNAPKSGNYANSIMVTSLPEAIIYDASQKLPMRPYELCQ